MTSSYLYTKPQNQAILSAQQPSIYKETKNYLSRAATGPSQKLEN